MALSLPRRQVHQASRSSSSGGAARRSAPVSRASLTTSTSSKRFTVVCSDAVAARSASLLLRYPDAEVLAALPARSDGTTVQPAQLLGLAPDEVAIGVMPG